MLKKNDIIALDIESISNDGNGVGHYEGMAIFVPQTAPGDRAQIRIVKVMKNYCFGILEQLAEASAERCTQDCGVYKRCGGCSLRHISYACELTQKQRWVSDAVRRIGRLELPVQPILGSPLVEGYRNKAQYPIGRDSNGNICCGFYAPRTHTLIPCSDCRLHPDFFVDICNVVAEYIGQSGAEVYDEATGKGLFRHLFIRNAEATGQVMVCLVINGEQIPHPQLLVDKLTGMGIGVASIMLNHNKRRTNVIMGERNTLVWGKPVIIDRLCGVELELSPLSFYQVNRLGAEQLYSQAAQLAELEDGQLLLDLYCGTGAIGLSMVRYKPNVQLIGVEVVPGAVEDARRNADRAGITNARFLTADAGQAAARLASEGLRPDVVVIDPPRKGCDELTLQSIAAMSPKKIVMVSCNPATMARDLAWLCINGFEANRILPVDMFPRTGHVETVVLMSKVR